MRRFVECLSVCRFVLVFFSPLSIAITSLGEERANLNAFRTFVWFVLVWIFFNIPTESWKQIAQDRTKWRGLIRRGAGDYEAKRISEAEQIAQDRTKWRGLIRRGAGDYEAKRISEAEQKCAQRKARAKASPTHQQSFLPQTSLVLSATGSLELR